MKKTTKAASVLAVSVIAFMLSTPAAFAEDSYVPDAVAGLSNSSVYVDGDATLGNQNQIASSLEGTNIDVVVLPPLALNTYTITDMASMIRSQTGDSTIVVVIDNNGASDRIGVSSDKNQEEIATILNQGLSANNGDAGSTISSSIQEVKDLSAHAQTNSNSADGGFSALPIILVVALVGGVGGVILKRRKNRNQGSSAENANESAVKATTAPTRFSDNMPSALVPLLKQLSELMKKHNSLKQSSLSMDMKIIIDNLQELFSRLSKKGTPSQQRMAEVEYADKLPKLIEALGDNYYIDIVQHDELWDSSKERLQAVKEAVLAVEKQLVENIRQVNASKDLEFQVALDSLVKSANATTINDVFKTQS